MITIFSAMRPFRGEAADLQRNAIRSWLAVRPACEVVLIDDEEGTTPGAVADLGVRTVSGVRRSGLGVPLFDSFLEAGAENATGDVLVCTTADVLFPPNFADVVASVERAMDGADYLLVSGRYDLARPIHVDFAEPGWFDAVRAEVWTARRPDYRSGIDTWVYPRRVRLRPPPFPVGRHGTDGWAVYDMKRRGIQVIDVTGELCLVHQHHGKPAGRDPRFHEEMRDCARLFDGMAEHALNLLDADWLWRDGRLERPRGFRRLHSAMSLFRPYRFLVGQRRRLRLPHLYGSSVRLERRAKDC